MKTKSVVKVMNFHSLLRVDKAKKEAEKYFFVEKELREMIDSITNNRNIILDQQVMQMNTDGSILNVYIGSDLGFCGTYNYVVSNEIRNDSADKIIIGKKVKSNDEKVKLYCTKQEYTENPELVSDYIKESINKGAYSEINVLYNNYKNASTIEWTKRRVFPFELNSEESSKYTDDFISESDITTLVANMVSAYVDFEIQIVVKNSLASENIMRQSSTNDSLKKIDEIEEERAQIDRKISSMISSQKNVERYIKRRERKKRVNG